MTVEYDKVWRRNSRKPLHPWNWVEVASLTMKAGDWDRIDGIQKVRWNEEASEMEFSMHFCGLSDDGRVFVKSESPKQAHDVLVQSITNISRELRYWSSRR